MALDASQGYDEYLNYLDAAVKDSFQGKYVFRAYILGAQSGTDEQNARMLESTEKLMKRHPQGFQSEHPRRSHSGRDLQHLGEPQGCKRLRIQ